MMLSHRRTKIVATIGPASRSSEGVRSLIEAGMNVARLNLSHGTLDEHLEVLQLVRHHSTALGLPTAVLLDLSGPKIRIGPVAGGQVELQPGGAVSLRYGTGEEGNASTLFTDVFEPAKVLRPGQKVLLSDGLVSLEVKAVTAAAAECIVVDAGAVRSRSGLLVPGSDFEMAAVTEKDRINAAWGVKNDVDYIALSFVRSPSDVTGLKTYLKSVGGSVPVVAKIETARALDHLHDIVQASDAVMVARGDLGIELALEKVPAAQKRIIAESNEHGRPVITATQMLRSMVEEQRPTRAEVSDVCTAVRDGADAVMLSEETTIGKHPALAVQILHRILVEAEKEFLDDGAGRRASNGGGSVADATCCAACSAANKVAAAAIVVCTESGVTGRLVARYRPNQPLFAMTTNASTLRRLSLSWGIRPLQLALPEEASTEDEIGKSLEMLRDCCGLLRGSTVVITVGMRRRKSGSTSIMQIREIV